MKFIPSVVSGEEMTAIATDFPLGFQPVPCVFLACFLRL